MPARPPFEIRHLSPTDQPQVYDLLRATLVWDRFSSDLIREKLFFNPRPSGETYGGYVAVAGGALVGVMQVVARPAAQRGWIGLFAVAPACQRQGIGTALLERCLADLHVAGVETVEVLALPGNYFTPGLDPRYTEALCFLEARGFTRHGDCANLLADLSRPFDTAGVERQLQSTGLVIRRATRADEPLLDAFFATDFGADWRMEAGLALRNDPPGMHLALREGKVIAFSGHSSQNREWGFFGPMGTTPSARGTGIGRLLLWHCLNDLRAAGHQTAVIPWVGPIGFYRRHVPCRVERVFWRYKRSADDKWRS